MRQRQLDGIRGFGILVVIAAHHQLTTNQFFLTNGWPLVDLFFVLSGYLITRGLLHTREQPKYFQQFYLKRAGRILPALVILLVLAPFLATNLHPRSWLGYALFFGNYINTTRYSCDIFIVLWSLAIEEHFYLLWPVVVRFVHPKHCLRICLAVLVIAPVLRFIFTPWCSSFRPMYYLTWFRMDPIAAGCILGLLPTLYPVVDRRLRRWSLAAFCVTVSVFMLAAHTWPATFVREANNRMFNTFAYTLVTMGCFFFCAYLASNDRTLIARALSLLPLVFLGDLVYGLYLYHMLVLAFFRLFFYTGLRDVAQVQHLFWWDLPAVVLFSWLSYRYVERPALDWCNKKARELRQGTRKTTDSKAEFALS